MGNAFAVAPTKKQIKAVLFIEDLAVLLGASVRTLRRRRTMGTMPKELRELPAVGGTPRWSGQEVATRYLKLSPEQFEIV